MYRAKAILVYGFVALCLVGCSDPANDSSDTGSTNPPLYRVIEIKGLRLGMTESEAEEKVGKMPFTVAGVEAMNSRPIIEFYENKLDYFLFAFDEDKFEDVLQSVKTKYPDLKCVESTLSNAMGASFQQVTCRMHNQLGSLTLERYGANTHLDISALSLQSYRRINEWEEKQKAKQSDI
jgi:hypothetical protein